MDKLQQNTAFFMKRRYNAGGGQVGKYLSV
jgi:hypothetical protein